MQADELAPGLWRWTTVHPDWKPGNTWDAEVACFYAETAAATLLVDPLVPADERERFLGKLDEDVRRRGVPVAILLTSEWHRRSADELAERYDARIHIAPDAPPDVEARELGEEPALWIAELGALVVGDNLISVDGELRLWVPDAADAVRAVLELPIEHVLVGHGDHVPGGREALAAALERPPYG